MPPASLIRLIPFNQNVTRALSAFDLKHVLVASYEYQLPLERLLPHAKTWLEGWTVSGITRLSSSPGLISWSPTFPQSVTDLLRIVQHLLRTSEVEGLAIRHNSFRELVLRQTVALQPEIIMHQLLGTIAI
jgi:hypothetical protein